MLLGERVNDLLATRIPWSWQYPASFHEIQGVVVSVSSHRCAAKLQRAHWWLHPVPEVSLGWHLICEAL